MNNKATHSKVRAKVFALGVALGVTACGGQIAADRNSLSFPSSDQQIQIEGTLVEVRCYFATGAGGGDHSFCAFLSAKANLPLGILTAKQEFIFLTSAPSRLAGHVTKQVQVQGLLTPNRQLLRPTSMRVNHNGNWTQADIER